MSRLPRVDIPGIAQHVVQRGNDRQPCFFTSADYEHYRTALNEIALREGCAIHAYVLMTNHVHLLLTPSGPGQVSRLMQSLGRCYVRRVNNRYHRTGTLWEGRYKACLVASERYILQCLRYIELNPLRAGMIADPSDYPWSSHRHNALGEHDRLVHPHPAYLALGKDAAERQQAYRALVMQCVSAEETDAIRAHLQRQHLYGPDRFRRTIEAQLGRSVGPRKIGRPRKPVDAHQISDAQETLL